MSREIYFALCGDRIKIGISANVAARLADLRTGAGGPLTLIASVEGDHEVERALHKKLHQYRVDREWFRDCPEVRAAIQHTISHFPPSTQQETVRRTAAKFKAVCKILWPEFTAEALAEIAGTDRRTGTRWLSGHSEPPAIVIAAVIVEITRKQ